MRALTITRGLPGSGKTTRAVAYLAEAPPGSLARLNRDDYRTMMFGGWTGDSRHEARVTIAQHTAVRALLLDEVAGANVICDDTNLTQSAMARWIELAADVGARLHVLDLRTVPLSQCLANNDRRQGTPAFVEPHIITGMWTEHIKPILEKGTAP